MKKSTRNFIIAKCVELERQLNAAKTEIGALREVINEIYDSFADEPQSDSSLLLNDRQVTALSKIKPFIK
jgi:hypothetical protein